MTWDPKNDGLPQIENMLHYLQSVSFLLKQFLNHCIFHVSIMNLVGLDRTMVIHSDCILSCIVYFSVFDPKV